MTQITNNSDGNMFIISICVLILFQLLFVLFLYMRNKKIKERIMSSEFITQIKPLSPHERKSLWHLKDGEEKARKEREFYKNKYNSKDKSEQ